MTYWFMAEGRDDPQHAIKMQINPLSMPQINKRLKDAKRRLKACCKGLLEPQLLQTNQYGLLPSSAFFLWRVSFLHRTVKDFFRLDHINELLRRRCSPGWSPYPTICRTILAQMKTAPSDPDYWRQPTDRTEVHVANLMALFKHCVSLWKKQHKICDGALEADMDKVMAERKTRCFEIHRACESGNGLVVYKPQATIYSSMIPTQPGAPAVQRPIHRRPVRQPVKTPTRPKQGFISRCIRKLSCIK